MRFFLPSGAQVELGSGEPLDLPGALGDELRGLRAPPSRPLDDLSLADLHVIRALARKLRLVDEGEVEIRCSNCREEMRVRPCSALELGPFVDGELDDPELDAGFDFSRSYPVPAVRAGSPSDECEVRLAPRNVAEARPLHEAVVSDRPLRITSKVAIGMGVVELDGEKHPKRIARLLAQAPDSAFESIAALFEDAHYPARLDVPHLCPSCGVTEWLSVPLSRELGLEPPAGVGAPLSPDDAAFMSVDEFESIVRAEAERAYSDLKIWQIDLSVIEGPAEVDDGGEPLLGCYRPPDPEGLVPRPAEIRLFFRTFANIAHDEGPYDVESEVRETLRHELEHHLAHLAGDDPVDDEEHAEIHRERSRRVGQKEVARRAARGLSSELRAFFSRTWWVWAIALVATLLAALAQSR